MSAQRRQAFGSSASFIQDFPVALDIANQVPAGSLAALVLFGRVDDDIYAGKPVPDQGCQAIDPLAVARVGVFDDDEVYVAPLVGVAPGEGAEEDNLLRLLPVPDAPDEPVEVGAEVS